MMDVKQSNTYTAPLGREKKITPPAGTLLLALADLSQILQEVARNPAVKIDAYTWQDDPEAVGQPGAAL